MCSPNFFVTLLCLLRSSRVVTKKCILCIYLHFILYILTFCASAQNHVTRPNCDQFKVPMIPDGHWYSSIYTYLILFRTEGVYISDLFRTKGVFISGEPSAVSPFPFLNQFDSLLNNLTPAPVSDIGSIAVEVFDL